MKNQEKSYLKLHLQQEFAYEVIGISILVIFFGLAFLFATNLLSFNWYSVLFVVLFLFGLYMKRSCYLVIDGNQLTIQYYRFAKPFQLEMTQIDEITFHQRKRQVELKDMSGTVTLIYLNMKNKQTLLNFLVQHYPNIDCMHI